MECRMSGLLALPGLGEFNIDQGTRNFPAACRRFTNGAGKA
jgi:hypothetical protein